MFKKIKASRIKRKADKMAEESKSIYIMSHIILILSNNLKAMKTINDQQKTDLYNMYIKTLFNSMNTNNQIMFSKALTEVNDVLSKINNNVPNSQIEIKKQLDEIFRSQG